MTIESHGVKTINEARVETLDIQGMKLNINLTVLDQVLKSRSDTPTFIDEGIQQALATKIVAMHNDGENFHLIPRTFLDSPEKFQQNFQIRDILERLRIIHRMCPKTPKKGIKTPQITDEMSTQYEEEIIDNPLYTKLCAMVLKTLDTLTKPSKKRPFKQSRNSAFTLVQPEKIRRQEGSSPNNIACVFGNNAEGAHTKQSKQEEVYDGLEISRKT